MSDETAPTGVARRLSREYGWLIAAIGLGTVVLVCSVPFVTGRGMSWNSGDPFAARVESPAGSASGGVPDESAGPQTSASPSAAPTPTPGRAQPEADRQRRPAARTSSPTPPRTTAPPAAPAAPAALGPEGGSMGLWQLLREYCQRTYGSSEAQLRNGAGQAENNWECRRRGEDPLIDVSAACRGRYGSGAFAQFSNRNDAFSWRCFRR